MNYLLFICSGGGDYSGTSSPLRDRDPMANPEAPYGDGGPIEGVGDDMSIQSDDEANDQ